MSLLDDNDHYARWSYEQLLLQQPHIAFSGLWRLDWRYFVVCPTLETARTVEGKDLAKWFHNNCRVVTAPIVIVASCPPSAERVPERTAAERVALVGAPRSTRDVLVDMDLALSKHFPPFTIRPVGAKFVLVTKVVLVTKEPLNASQADEAQTAFASFGYGTLDFETDPAWDSKSDAFRDQGGQGDLYLLPSRRLPTCFGSSLRSLLEEDEDFWVDNKNQVLASLHTDPNSLLPETWTSSKGLSCFVEATVLHPENIRRYLSLYNTVHLALPIAERFQLACEAMGVKPMELRKLVEMGRLKIVLPQALDRYRPDWLSEVADNAPQGLLFSRRLAAAAIADARRRIPYLYPPLGPADRYLLLHRLLTNSRKIVGADKEEPFVAGLRYLSSTWAQMEQSIQYRGAIGTTALGIGGFSAMLFEHFTGRDLRLEFWGAGLKVSWAAALGSHAFPYKSEEYDYDETALCDLVASVYSTTPNVKIRTAPPRALAAVADILVIDNDVPVLDFAENFSSATINRVRKFILKIIEDNPTTESVEAAIRSFNKEVRHYEKRADRLQRVNIIGFLAGLAVASGEVVNPDIARLVPLVGEALGFFLRTFIDKAPRRYERVGAFVDFLNSVLAGRKNPDAVLVAHTRKDVAALKT